MPPSEIKLDLFIVDKDADAEQLDELTVRLMRDLRELGAESVERFPGEDVPDGAKRGAFTVGALALVAVPAVLPSLVDFLQTWSLRGESRKVHIKIPAGLEIEFTPVRKMSQQEVLALVEQLTTSKEGAGAAPAPSPAALSGLGVDCDSLPGDGKADKERELIEHLDARPALQLGQRYVYSSFEEFRIGSGHLHIIVGPLPHRTESRTGKPITYVYTKTATSRLCAEPEARPGR